jgi:hypothetical protein
MVKAITLVFCLSVKMVFYSHSYCTKTFTIYWQLLAFLFAAWGWRWFHRRSILDVGETCHVVQCNTWENEAGGTEKTCFTDLSKMHIQTSTTAIFHWLLRPLVKVLDTTTTHWALHKPGLLLPVNHWPLYKPGLLLPVNHWPSYETGLLLPVNHWPLYKPELLLPVSHWPLYKPELQLPVNHWPLYKPGLLLPINYWSLYKLELPLLVNHWSLYKPGLQLTVNHWSWYKPGPSMLVNHWPPYI